jgi:hypothetical protein
MADDQLPWLRPIDRLQIVDRWSPRIPKRPAKTCTGAPDCRWCNHQESLKAAGKKSKPLDQCPWKNWEPDPPPSQTIPATERFELIEVIRVPHGRRNRPVGDSGLGETRHIGYYATREAAEAAKKGRQMLK